MSLLIDVGSVLRTTVCDLYSNLVTRPTGAAVRTAIERQVLEIGSPVVTTIDFSQVELLDFSCADEIVAKLLLRYAQTDGPISGYLLFRGIRETHVDPIEAVLERHELALVAWHDERASLIGSVSDDERATWQAVHDHGPLHPERLASIRTVSVELADGALRQLLHRRLLMLQDDGYVVPGAHGAASLPGIFARGRLES